MTKDFKHRDLRNKVVPSNKGRTVARKDLGASRGKSESQPLWGRLIKIALQSCAGLVLTGMVAAAVYFGQGFVEQASSRPINSVAVEGSFQYLNREMIAREVEPMMENGFLKVPLGSIKTSLEANPWVEYVAVSRRWPDKLFITIQEEQPIARWKNAGFLNHKGKLVTVALDGRLADLPELSGVNGQEAQVMENYQQLAQLLRPYGLSVAALYCDELLSWRVELQNNLVLNLGRDEMMEKVQRFLVVYQTSLKERLTEVAAVDLRYGNGIAVEWKQVEKPLEQVAVVAR